MEVYHSHSLPWQAVNILLLAPGCAQALSAQLLPIPERLARKNGPALENIIISQRMLVLSCTQRKPGCTWGKLGERLGETPWALHTHGEEQRH